MSERSETNKKQAKGKDPTEIIMSDLDFRKSFLDTISKIRRGKMKWHTYAEVFN